MGSWAVLKRRFSVYKQVDERYGKDTEPGVREQVARHWVIRELVLGKMGRSEEAIVALRKAEVIFAALGMTEDEQQARKLIEQWKKKK